MESSKVLPRHLVMEKIKYFCNYRERCEKEVREKLEEIGLYSNDIQQVINDLITSGYINDKKFAESYVSGKHRLKNWGRVKIRRELEEREIPESYINKSLSQIVESEYHVLLNQILAKKVKDYRKDKDKKKKLNKIVIYMISKGYEKDLIWKYVRENHPSLVK